MESRFEQVSLSFLQERLSSPFPLPSGRKRLKVDSLSGKVSDLSLGTGEERFVS